MDVIWDTVTSRLSINSAVLVLGNLLELCMLPFFWLMGPWLNEPRMLLFSFFAAQGLIAALALLFRSWLKDLAHQRHSDRVISTALRRYPI